MLLLIVPLVLAFILIVPSAPVLLPRDAFSRSSFTPGFNPVCLPLHHSWSWQIFLFLITSLNISPVNLPLVEFIFIHDMSD